MILSALQANGELDITEWLREEYDTGGGSFRVAALVGPDALAPICDLQRRRGGALREIDQVEGVPGDMLVRDSLQVAICVGHEFVIAFGQILAHSGKSANCRISDSHIGHCAALRCSLDFNRYRQGGQSQVDLCGLPRD